MTESRTSCKRQHAPYADRTQTRRRMNVRMGNLKRKKAPEGAFFDGAGDGIRTHDPNLGKVVLYP